MPAASWIEDWWTWVAAATLQGTLLLVAASIADRVLVRRVWPQVLRLFWMCALARFFVTPELSSPMSVTSGLGEPLLRATGSFAPGPKTMGVVFVVWLAGAASCLALRVVRRAQLRARLSPARPSRAWIAALERAQATIGARHTPRIATLDGLATPAVFGLIRPWLLVPRGWLARAPSSRDEHALAHELAHIARRDLWLDELCALVRALVWFHPLAWLAAERVHALGEIACDQTVVQALGADARAYRDTLVLAAAGSPACSAPSAVRAFCAHPSAVVLRVEILDRGFACSRNLVRAASLALAPLLAVCVLPMSTPSSALRLRAERVFAAARSGERQSCFALQAAALVLSADSKEPPSGP